MSGQTEQEFELYFDLTQIPSSTPSQLVAKNRLVKKLREEVSKCDSDFKRDLVFIEAPPETSTENKSPKTGELQDLINIGWQVASFSATLTPLIIALSQLIKSLRKEVEIERPDGSKVRFNGIASLEKILKMVQAEKLSRLVIFVTDNDATDLSE